ncbi:MAG: hypothetical protein F4087_04480 [Gemmatimonadetes bacterium]|nr:hypothetical protein [Gemmatimonadota bacterium]MYE69958.1 hypothetical protein [Gemmatimonadota bacterium]MYJ67758.1 hypothetical protein [Gemmatimonadota bacterium]
MRIGSARRREFAAWRYMQRFRRRLIRENAQHVPWAVGAIGLKVGLLTPFSGVMLAGAGAFYGWQFLRTVGRVRVGVVLAKMAREKRVESSGSDPGT